jgi:spore coat protein A
MALTRRNLLKAGVLGSAALVLPTERAARTAAAVVNRIPASRLPRPFTVPLAVAPVLQPVRRTATTDYYLVTMRKASVEIIPGLRTDIWGYNGIAPGPTIKVQQGREAVVRQINQLPDSHPTLLYRPDTSVHLHGSASLPQYDGYASDLTRPGEYKDYRYPNFQNARTLWYHDHAVHRTATNVYMGLAGQYHLHDALEASLPLPKGRYDVPLTVKDAIFAQDGSLVWDDSDESGLYGDVVLVNGRPWPAMALERRKYRFRLLNASVSRSYRLTLNTGGPMTVIATDGGLMPAPQTVKDFRFGPAERYEVVIDFAKYPIGTRVVLKNLGLPNSPDFGTTGNVMAFDVASEPTDTSNNTIPAVVDPSNPVMVLTAAMAKRERRLEWKRKNGHWTVNGKTWADVVKSGFKFAVAKPELNDVEVWELANPHGGWSHPIHVHLVDFRVLSRNGKPPFAYEQGPKDVVYLGKEETVRVVARFGPHRGRYMMHCHNLVHEDHDMMVQFEVGEGGPDPIASAPARPLPAPEL